MNTVCYQEATVGPRVVFLNIMNLLIYCAVLISVLLLFDDETFIKLIYAS